VAETAESNSDEEAGGGVGEGGFSHPSDVLKGGGRGRRRERRRDVNEVARAVRGVDVGEHRGGTRKNGGDVASRRLGVGVGRELEAEERVAGQERVEVCAEAEGGYEDDGIGRELRGNSRGDACGGDQE